MSTQRKPGEHATQPVMAALRRLKHNRGYAMNEGAQLALGAIAEAWRQSKRYTMLLSSDLEPLVEQLAQFDFLGLLQQRATEPERIVWPMNPVTGERLRNPWESGGSLGDRNLVHKLSPRLAGYLERCAKGEQWQMYVEDLQATAERAELAGIRYSEAEHKTNPFITGNRTEQAEFVKANSPDFPTEGLKVAFYRREAQPIELPWSQSTLNRTHLGLLVKADAELAELAMRATLIEQDWLAEQRQIAAAEEAEAKAKLETIQARLHGSPQSEQQRRAELAHAAAQR